jgi:hypothetical protein
MGTTEWRFTNPAIVPNANVAKTLASGNDKAIAALPSGDIAMTIHADTILRNGKALSGTVVNLTVGHIRDDETFSLSLNPEDRTATVVRTEGAKGRKARVGADEATIASFLSGLRS